ncbi:glycosyltransferase [bacterium]|nr:glycosyltransferase [bacterium]
MALWLAFSLFCNLHYAWQFLLSYFALKKLPTAFKPDEKGSIKFSIVVALRHEVHNIPTLLSSLTSFDYPPENYEIILVDDFSEDETVAVARKLIAECKTAVQIKCYALAEEGLLHNRAFKRTAIQLGVNKANFDWIVTTDADCIHHAQYLRTLAGFIKKHQPKFVSAPVHLSPAQTLFQKMQSLEFKGLVGLGAAYIQRERPFLCNGANLAFQRKVFIQLNGYKGTDKYESGDDVWFMHKVQHRFPFEIYFAMHSHLIVKSAPCPDVPSFINQRKRWTSKNTGYHHLSQLATLSFDYLYYCAIAINAVLAFFSPAALHLLYFMLLTKVAVEVNFYSTLNYWIKTPWWSLTYLLTFPVQIFYVIAIYPLSQLTKYQWKNRFFNARPR